MTCRSSRGRRTSRRMGRLVSTHHSRPFDNLPAQVYVRGFAAGSYSGICLLHLLWTWSILGGITLPPVLCMGSRCIRPLGEDSGPSVPPRSTVTPAPKPSRSRESRVWRHRAQGEASLGGQAKKFITCCPRVRVVHSPTSDQATAHSCFFLIHAVRARGSDGGHSPLLGGVHATKGSERQPSLYPSLALCRCHVPVIPSVRMPSSVLRA